MTKTVDFFLGPNDSKAVLSHLETSISVRYAECLHYPDKKIPVYSSFTQIPALGTMQVTSFAQAPIFLIVKRWSWIRLRRIPARDRAVFALDQMENQKSITLKPGGFYSSEAIVRGSAGTISDTGASLQLLDRLQQALNACSRKIGPYWVGPEALQAYRSGARLVTTSVRQKEDFDFRPQI